MPARESALVKRVKKYIRDNGGYVVKTCPPMEAGTPDLLVCWKGIHVGVELKAEGKKPSPLQLLRIKEIREAGGIAFWADDFETVERKFEAIDNILESFRDQLGMLSEVSAC